MTLDLIKIRTDSFITREKDMNKQPLTLFKLQATLFESYQPNSTTLIKFLTKTINDGYDYNQKYQIIISTRVKNEKLFLANMGFDNQESFIYVLVKSGNYDSSQLMNVSVVKTDKSFNFDGISQDDVIGTIGGKVHTDDYGKGWELTGFVSKIKGVGKFLINFIQQRAIEESVPFLFCTVISEHGLVQYYNQYGFVEEGKQLKQIIDKNGLVQDSDLEDEVYAYCDFHIAFLRWITPKQH